MTGLRTHKKKACITGPNTGFFFSPSALPESHRQILCKQRKERKWVKCPERWRERCTFPLSACRRSPLCQIIHLSLRFRPRTPDERHQHNPAAVHLKMITFPDNTGPLANWPDVYIIPTCQVVASTTFIITTMLGYDAYTAIYWPNYRSLPLQPPDGNTLNSHFLFLLLVNFQKFRFALRRKPGCWVLRSFAKSGWRNVIFALFFVLVTSISLLINLKDHILYFPKLRLSLVRLISQTTQFPLAS